VTLPPRIAGSLPAKVKGSVFASIAPHGDKVFVKLSIVLVRHLACVIACQQDVHPLTNDLDVFLCLANCADRTRQATRYFHGSKTKAARVAVASKFHSEGKNYGDERIVSPSVVPRPREHVDSRGHTISVIGKFNPVVSIVSPLANTPQVATSSR